MSNMTKKLLLQTLKCREATKGLGPKRPLDIATCLTELIEIERERLLVEKRRMVVLLQQAGAANELIAKLKSHPLWASANPEPKKRSVRPIYAAGQGWGPHIKGAK